MNRRRFIKALGIGAAGAGVASALPAVAADVATVATAPVALVPRHPDFVGMVWDDSLQAMLCKMPDGTMWMIRTDSTPPA